ncbi:MAG: DUF4167 domain-containing protein [Pseudomonadota bacterium]
MKRQRGRGRRSGGGNSSNPNRHFESNGPDVKIRGSAQQILDKYQQYARDAQSSGDRVSAENYLQHAEHYSRVLAAMQPKDKPRDEQKPQNTGEEAGDTAETVAEAANPETAGDAEDAVEGKPTRGRGRRRKRDEQAVASEGETEQSTESPSTDNESEVAVAEEEPEKPKPRRTRRKPREDSAKTDTEREDDGVMKTLSRGRPVEKTDADASPAEADTLPETAAE